MKSKHNKSFVHTPLEQKQNRMFFSSDIRPILSGYIPPYQVGNKKKRRRIGLLQLIARKISRTTY